MQPSLLVHLLADGSWGYAEADPTLTGAVIVLVTLLAVLYLVVRIPLPPRSEAARDRFLASLGWTRPRGKRGD